MLGNERTGTISPLTARRQMTWRYLIALALIGCLATISYLTATISIESEQESGAIINVSGRQRMLSQRIAFYINRADNAGRVAESENPLEEARAAIDLFEKSHNALITGSGGLGLTRELHSGAKAIYYGPKALDTLSRNYVELARDAVAHLEGGKRVPEDLLDRLNVFAASSLLRALDAAVKEFERDSRTKIDRLMAVETAVFFLTIALLLLEGTLIFQPTVRRIYHAMVVAREAERYSTRAARDRKLVLDTVSHELHTPLNLLSYSLATIDPSKLTEEQTYSFSRISEAASDIMETVGAVLTYVSIDSGDAEIQLAPVDTQQMINNVIEHKSKDAEKKNLKFYSQAIDDKRADLPVLMLDREHVTQIISRLVSNAIRFTDRGRVILGYGFFEKEKGSGCLKIRIQDTGIGIPKESINDLFSPFQSSARSGDQKRGLGLGLNYAKQMTERMGGKIEVNSKLGNGSAFTITLPAKVAQPTAGEPSQQNLTAPSGLKCLIAEDNPVNQLIIVRLLMSDGHTVKTVENGKQAVEAASQETYDAILLDIVMPEMRGDEACRQIRAMNQQNCPPIIAVTANALPEDIKGYMEAGFCSVVAKPIEPEKLRSAMKLRPNTHQIS